MVVRLENDGVFQAWVELPNHFDPPPAILWGARFFAADKIEAEKYPVYQELTYLAVVNAEIMEDAHD